MFDRLPVLTERTVAAVQAEEPWFRTSTASIDDLWLNAHESLRAGAQALLASPAEREAALRRTRSVGLRRARRGLPLNALLHAYRIAGGVFLQGLVEAADGHDVEEARLLLRLTGQVWSYVDRECTVIAEAYREVERELAERHGDHRSVLLDALLDGRMDRAEIPAAAALLDLPESGRYAVLLVQRGRPKGGSEAANGSANGSGGGSAKGSAKGSGDGSGGNGGIGRSAADDEAVVWPAPDGMRLLWRHRAAGAIALVALGDGAPADLAAELTLVPGTRVAVGSAVHGLAQVGRARDLAELAMRSCTEETEAALLDERLPAALVLADRDLSARLPRRVLGPVLRLGAADRNVLLSTVGAWLDCGGSVPRAAARLFCHRNTVLNRLRRFEHLTGRSIGSPREVTEITLALDAYRLLGADAAADRDWFADG